MVTEGCQTEQSRGKKKGEEKDGIGRDERIKYRSVATGIKAVRVSEGTH